MVAVEIEGSPEQIEQAVIYLRERGVKVEAMEGEE